MRRLFALLVVAGLVLAIGCGPGSKVVEPTNVPPPPKGPPGAQKVGSEANKPTAAPPVQP
jgi:hypothetical protein